MQNKFKTKKLWLIIGGIVLLLGIVSFGVYKLVQTDKRKAEKFEKTVSVENKPDQTIPPFSEELPVFSKTKEKELGKYLLEKRLDLKKYFVFNLGKEVKVARSKLSHDEQGSKTAFIDDIRPMKEALAADLTKLSDYYWKQLKQKPGEWKIDKRTEKNYTGKDTLSFGKKVVKEWEGDELNKKINQGENWFIIFEKKNLELYFHIYREKKIVGLHEYVTIPIDTSFCHIFRDKLAALIFLKNNDPAFADKI